MGRQELEVGAGQAGCVGSVDDDGAVAEEAGGTLNGGGIEVEVGSFEGAAAGDVTVLAAEIADLAGLWLGRVTGRLFTAYVGVEVGKGGGAVAGGWNGLVVDVVDCEAREVNVLRRHERIV